MSSFRSFLYWFARFLGDIGAVQRVPRAIEKRIERRIVGNVVGRIVWKRFK